MCMGTSCQGGTRRLTERDPRVAFSTYVSPHSPSRIPRAATLSLVATDPTRVDPLAIEQLNASASLAGIARIVGLPDLHAGRGIAVGAAFWSRGFVHPHLVGSDIGCGMALWRTDLKLRRFRLDAAEKKLHGLEAPWPGDHAGALAEAGLPPDLYGEGLGSIGGGNHFAEALRVEELVDADGAAALGIDPAQLLLLVHSGSRGLGQAILDRYLAQGGGALAEGTEAVTTYRAVHDEAVRWAELNRTIIAARLFDRLGIAGTRLLDICHNSVMPHAGGWLHRKGAAPADKGAIVIPGSRGALSYAVRPHRGQRHRAADLNNLIVKRSETTIVRFRDIGYAELGAQNERGALKMGDKPIAGLLADLASKGFLTDLGDKNATWMKDNYAAGQSWVDLGTYKGKDGANHFYGFSYKADLKSLVWYSPENFEDAGYEVPQTMEDLKALTEKIAATGAKPWCIGLGSGGATGWPATDWVEDMMLRTQPADVYDKWVTNEVKFNDPAVVAAIDEFGFFARNDKFVDGGSKAVASTAFRDSPKGLFTVPPQCYLHKQASFITSFFPEGSVAGTDYDFFYLPPMKAHPELGNPVEGSGNLVSITKGSPAARAFIEFLQTPIANEIWMAQPNSSFLTALKTVNTKVYSSDALRKLGDILLNATTFRFDGSDLMPGAIGAGAFWTGMVDYVNGKSSKDVADAIQAAWDKL
eukprot:gene29147-38606_t